MFCKNCGAHMEDSYNVCQNCGTRKGLGVAFCDKCGAVRQAGMAFCQNCGAKMEDTPVASQASTPYSQQTTAQQFQSNASVNNQQYMPAKLYCRNCGKQMMNNQAICTACGVKKGDGNSFCPHCAAPVSNPQQVACTSCGMSLAKAFDFGAYINEFGKNFASVFSGDILGNLLEYGANLLSFLTFVFSFLPCVTFTVSAFGYSESDLHNIYYLSGFGGFLFLVAFLFSIARFVPHVKNFIESQGADIYILQEVDLNAKRSYWTNEYEGLKEDFKGTAAYAHMFNSLYIPYPFFNTVGHVESGLVTLNKYSVNSATRVAVPSSISWPKRAVMYKNCAIEERVKIEDSDKELIVYNLHLDAYGSGDKKTEQLDVLMEQMKAEYEKGNYVVAGGDFNQTFPGVDTEKFPIIDDSHYVPATLPEDYLPDNWRFAVDLNRPTSRLLNEVYSGNYENTQLYIIDGYILSPNVELVQVETIENNFSYSDHHPVSLKIKLK